MTSLEVVGGGRMGEAILAGLLRSGTVAASDLCVVERLPERRDELAQRFPGVAVVAEAVASQGAVLAVKPADVVEACREIALAGVERVLSIAAGITTTSLEAALGGGVAVVRAMPNTPAVVGEGASAVAAGDSATDRDLAWAEEVLSAVGVVVQVAEDQLDAVTGLSGSGPAYVFLVAESLIEAGVLVGLSRPVAEALAVQTIVGSGRLLADSDEHAAALRAAVTSPGGTTAAGLRELELAGVRAALLSAVTAATERSRQLGRG
jgi:pyrroline-5-carboxylate reductase